MAGTPEYGPQGKTFGKIIVAILLFVIMVIYIYHHTDNGITFPN